VQTLAYARPLAQAWAVSAKYRRSNQLNIAGVNACGPSDTYFLRSDATGGRCVCPSPVPASRLGSLQFGIESYYVQEGIGRRYEQAIRDRHLSAELAVTSSGQAALRNLRIEKRRAGERPRRQNLLRPAASRALTP
jgi:GDYXXLXY motif protein